MGLVNYVRISSHNYVKNIMLKIGEHSSNYTHFSGTTFAQHNLKQHTGATFLSDNEDEYPTKKN
ncbi:hypothetical protein BpHYR1_053654 [Brachionus plicatilis]|uniref:Uncharacterized protein n=1 Tax=Brachionus plicatilis TaxID=10195 RepID=A0A3M7T7S6_BRAPC|nr:hypothetical protein BpHYR1_053654 [Brachionus plicatilis]